MLTQIAILAFSGTAIALLPCEDKKVARWGWPVGLLGQPFWLWSTWTAEPMLWGVFVLSLWFGVHYARGTWKYVIRPMLRGDL